MALSEQQMKFVITLRDQASARMKGFGNALRDAGNAARQAAGGLNNFGAAANRANNSARGAAGGLGQMRSILIGLVSGAVLGNAIRLMAEFGDRMSTVKAVTGATGVTFDLLQAKAEELGQRTRFTASQAAEGMVELARGGMNAAQVLASIGGTMDLAASGTLDLATAANITIAALSSFNMQATQSGRVADLLSFTANKSATTVQDLGHGLTYVGSVANAFGVGLDTTLAAMGALADRGIRGSMAGTGLRQVLAKLAEASPRFTRQLTQMHLTMADVDVGARGLIPVLRSLRDAGYGDDPAALIAHFGTRAGPAMINLMDNLEKIEALQARMGGIGADGIEGFARIVAFTMDNNLGGAIRRLQSAWEGMWISMGQSQRGWLRDLLEVTGLAIRAMDLRPTSQQTLAEDIFTQSAARIGLDESAILGLEEGSAAFRRVQVEADAMTGRVNLLRAAFEALKTLIIGGVIIALGAFFATFGRAGVIVAGLAAIVFGFSAMRDQMITTEGKTASFGDIMTATWNRVKTSISGFFERQRQEMPRYLATMGEWYNGAARWLMSLGARFEGWYRITVAVLGGMGRDLRRWVNDLIDSVPFARQAIEAFGRIWNWLGEKISGIYRWAREGLADLLRDHARAGAAIDPEDRGTQQRSARLAALSAEVRRQAALALQETNAAGAAEEARMKANLERIAGTDYAAQLGAQFSGARAAILSKLNNSGLMDDAVGIARARDAQGARLAAEQARLAGGDLAVEQRDGGAGEEETDLTNANASAGAETFAAKLARVILQLNTQTQAMSQSRGEQMRWNAAMQLGIAWNDKTAISARVRVKEAVGNQLLALRQSHIRTINQETYALGERARIAGLAVSERGFETLMLEERLRIATENNVTDIASIKISDDVVEALRRRAAAGAAASTDQRTMTQGLMDGLREWAQKAGDVGSQMSSAMGSIMGTLTDAFTSFFMGQKVEWSDLARSIISQIAKIIIQMLVMKAVMASLKLFGFSSGGEPGEVTPNKHGNAFAQRGIQAFAKGSAFANSVVSSPTLFKFAKGAKIGVMGEAGPEAIVPLKRMRNGDLGISSDGAGGGSIQSVFAPNITIKIEGGGGGESGDTALAGKVGKLVKDVLRKEMQDFQIEQARAAQRLTRFGN